jgi:Tfp pilus assembly protein PilO
MLIILLIIIVFSWNYLFYAPVTHQQKIYQERFAELNDQFTQLLTLNTNYSSLKGSVDKLRNEFLEYKNDVVPKDEFPKVLDYITNLGDEYRITVETINPSITNVFPIEEKYQKKFIKFAIHKYPVNMKLAGKFLDVGNYFEAIINSEYRLELGDLSLISTTEYSPNLQVNALLFGYVAVED